VSGRTRLVLALAGALAVLALVAVLVWWWLARRGDGADGAADGGPGATVEVAVDLYFPGEGATLGRERRRLSVPEDPEGRLLALARAVLGGPRSPSLLAPMPAGVEARGVYLTAGGDAYLDLVSSEEGAAPPSGGSTEEMLRVYSLVNSLALNVPEARRIALVWNGVQRETFSGHLDTSRPLAPHPALVERRR